MNQPDLSKENLALVLMILSKYLPLHAKIWLFGSRATGRAKKYSDIDLLIDIGNAIPMQLLSQLNSAFDESILPYKVDIADASTITDAFKENIKSQIIPLRNHA
jgi:predicted nucleotidyltransferase